MLLCHAIEDVIVDNSASMTKALAALLFGMLYIFWRVFVAVAEQCGDVVSGQPIYLGH